MNLRHRSPRYTSSLRLCAMAALCAAMASAGTITFSGVINQSTQDGTGPAVNNPALNGIADGDPYSVELDFPGAISGPGAFNPLPGASITFTDGSIVEAASFRPILPFQWTRILRSTTFSCWDASPPAAAVS